jgi:hypothetical protein
MIENVFVSSVSDWRRVDWLILAQYQFFPRLWIMNETDSPLIKELINLLDYRYWKGRFQRLNQNEATYCMLLYYITYYITLYNILYYITYCMLLYYSKLLT